MFFRVMTLIYFYLRVTGFRTSWSVKVDFITESLHSTLTYKSGFHPNVTHTLTEFPENWQKKM